MLTDTISRFRFGSLRSLSPSRFRSSTSEPPEIQSAPALPAFQMEYTVNGSDTLERIAAQHDCTVGELMKLNRMSSRMVFPGQKIVVPVPSSDDVFEQANHGSAKVHQSTSNQHSADGIRKGPGGAVPAQRVAISRAGSVPMGSTDENDTDCLQRFLKVKVKQVTESDGTVSGTLLVTPNCLMFDPDVTHPLVKENGQDLYGMVANLHEIVAVSVYKEISGLTGGRDDKQREIFDPEHVKTPEQKPDTATEDTSQEKVSFSCDPVNGEDLETSFDEQVESHSPNTKLGSDLQLPSITEEARGGNETDSPEDGERKRAVSDLTDVHNTSRSSISRSRTPSAVHSQSEERPRSFSELDAPPAQGISRFSPNAARRSFGKLGRTLSERAKSVHSSVTQGAERVAQTAVQGTKTVAHGVVTHTKSAADSLQTGIETSVKVVGEAGKAAATQAKAAADVVASVPGKVVDIGTNLVNDGINGVQEMFVVEEQRSASQMKREQSLATLEELKLKTQQARDDAKIRAGMFACATSTEEMPDLFMPVDQMMGRTASGNDASSPIPPYYMAVRLTRKRKPKRSSPTASTSVSSYDEDVAFGNKLKREFWFAVPRNKADNIYQFLLQWSPEKYGLDTTSADDSQTSQPLDTVSRDRGFIILDSTADESLTEIMGSGTSTENLAQTRQRSSTVRSLSSRQAQPRLSCPNYLTSYDVKQLMRDNEEQRRNSVREDSPGSNSDLLEDMHQQFYAGTPRKLSASSSRANSTGSHSPSSSDSGLGTPARQSLEDLHWGQPLKLDMSRKDLFDVPETPVETPTTPIVDVAKLFQRPFMKVQNRLQKKKQAMQRMRSQSLHPNQQFIIPGDEKSAPLFGSSLLNREWELVTVSEMCRRLSLDDLDQLELPIPEGASSSQILDELMIRQIMEILPPRAEGYPWVNIYNSEKHGFSLSTLYRKMVEFDEDLSPVLLIIRTTNEHVLGAVVSGAIRPSDHYSGTGDSCLLWRFTGAVPHTRELRQYNWTGENQFFVNAAKDSLSIGAGGGHYGLWLDADLNHGRSQKCDTFDNEPLAGEKEDFIVQFIEAFGFRM